MCITEKRDQTIQGRCIAQASWGGIVVLDYNLIPGLRPCIKGCSWESIGGYLRGLWFRRNGGRDPKAYSRFGHNEMFVLALNAYFPVRSQVVTVVFSAFVSFFSFFDSFLSFLIAASAMSCSKAI